jgi:hypothetical protein
MRSQCHSRAFMKALVDKFNAPAKKCAMRALLRRADTVPPDFGIKIIDHIFLVEYRGGDPARTAPAAFQLDAHIFERGPDLGERSRGQR